MATNDEKLCPREPTNLMMREGYKVLHGPGHRERTHIDAWRAMFDAAPIEGTDEAWDEGRLGNDARFARRAPPETEAAVDRALGIEHERRTEQALAGSNAQEATEAPLSGAVGAAGGTQTQTADSATAGMTAPRVEDGEVAELVAALRKLREVFRDQKIAMYPSLTDVFNGTGEIAERAAALITRLAAACAEERERCAKICESQPVFSPAQARMYLALAAAIRADTPAGGG